MDLIGNKSDHPDAEADVGAQLVFDDEPLDAILYGAPSPGPSSADLFAEARRAVSGINGAIDKKETERALRLMVGLFKTETPVPADMLIALAGYLRRFIPSCPCPLVEEHGVQYERILNPCFEAGCRQQDSALMALAGTLLYRWYEGCESYQAAGEVVARLLDAARRRGDLADEAVLTNNLGYDYLLDQRWDEAAPYFRCSTVLFERLGESCEAANIRSNALTCDAGGHGIESLLTKQRALIELACTLHKYRDWRARKPLILLARVREYEGRYTKAVFYARRAVDAGREVPSRHHLEDRAYLAALEGKCAGTGALECEHPAHAGG